MKIIINIFFSCLASQIFAQTDMDGLMMDKNLFCAGATYGNSKWDEYWEGTIKRENLNLGTITTSGIMVMGNYGISNKMNVLFGIPYIQTKAGAGQLKGQKGIQDLSLFFKWVGLEKHRKNAVFKGIVMLGVSAPVTNYTPDIMPLSIGLHSKTSSIKLMADYQQGNWFGTLSGAFIYRGNVQLDRDTYYTTRIHYSNTVEMSNACNYNLRAGYRTEKWILEAIANKWVTNKGFDISKNNMPFVSNKMDATTLGFHVKYEPDLINGLSFVADGMVTVAGRNVGQAKGVNAGIFYIMDFSKKNKTKIKK